MAKVVVNPTTIPSWPWRPLCSQYDKAAKLLTSVLSHNNDYSLTEIPKRIWRTRCHCRFNIAIYLLIYMWSFENDEKGFSQWSRKFKREIRLLKRDFFSTLIPQKRIIHILQKSINNSLQIIKQKGVYKIYWIYQNIFLDIKCI